MRLSNILVACFLAAMPLAAQNSTRADVELQKAIQREMVDGDLRGAMEAFRRLAARTAEPGVAAKALLHLAECHEKLGSAEAKKTYGELLRRYPDGQEAAVARQRMAGSSQAKTSMAVRKLWDGSRYGNTGSPSPDGRYLSFTRWVPNAEMGVLDTVTGQDWDVTKRPGAEYTMAMSGIFSPDSSELAYSWWGPDNKNELRIVPRTGGTPRTIFKAESGQVVPYAWTSDKRRILAKIRPGNRLAWISVADGSVTELTTMGRTQNGSNATLSPDGRFIAFDRPKSSNNRDFDVFVISSSGGAEVPIMEEVNREILLGWTPDGAHILVGSYRTGTMGAWLVPVKDGKPAGSPVLVKDSIGEVSSMGFDRKGTFYYNVNPGGSHQVFTARLDAASGQITSPVLANAQYLGGSWRPMYSPDGKALVMHRLGKQSGTIPPGVIVVDLATGTGREANVPGTGLFTWRSDSSLLGILGAGFVEVRLDGREPTPIDILRNPVSKDCNGTRVVRSQRRYVSVDTGVGVQPPFDALAVPMKFSSTCTSVAFVKDGVLSVSDAREGAPSRELVRLSNGEHFQDNASGIAWSLDDRFLYYVTYRDVHGDYELWRVPSTGGKPIFTGVKMPDLSQMSIHPDGNRIAFTSVRWNYEAWAIDNLVVSPRTTETAQR